MGIFGKKKAAPVAVVQSKLMDYDEMIDYFGLPPGTSLRDDNAMFEMFLPATTRLLEYKNKSYQSVELLNKGKAVAVIMSGKHIGDIDPKTHNEAIKAINTHGGVVAPAALSFHRSKTHYRILCPDGNKTN